MMEETEKVLFSWHLDALLQFKSANSDVYKLKGAALSLFREASETVQNVIDGKKAKRAGKLHDIFAMILFHFHSNCKPFFNDEDQSKPGINDIISTFLAIIIDLRMLSALRKPRLYLEIETEIVSFVCTYLAHDKSYIWDVIGQTVCFRKRNLDHSNLLQCLIRNTPKTIDYSVDYIKFLFSLHLWKRASKSNLPEIRTLVRSIQPPKKFYKWLRKQEVDGIPKLSKKFTVEDVISEFVDANLKKTVWTELLESIYKSNGYELVAVEKTGTNKQCHEIEEEQTVEISDKHQKLNDDICEIVIEDEDTVSLNNSGDDDSDNDVIFVEATNNGNSNLIIASGDNGNFIKAKNVVDSSYLRYPLNNMKVSSFEESEDESSDDLGFSKHLKISKSLFKSNSAVHEANRGESSSTCDGGESSSTLKNCNEARIRKKSLNKNAHNEDKDISEEPNSVVHLSTGEIDDCEISPIKINESVDDEVLQSNDDATNPVIVINLDSADENIVSAESTNQNIVTKIANGVVIANHDEEKLEKVKISVQQENEDTRTETSQDQEPPFEPESVPNAEVAKSSPTLDSAVSQTHHPRRYPRLSRTRHKNNFPIVLQSSLNAEVRDDNEMSSEPNSPNIITSTPATRHVTSVHYETEPDSSQNCEEATTSFAQATNTVDNENNISSTTNNTEFDTSTTSKRISSCSDEDNIDGNHLHLSPDEETDFSVPKSAQVSKKSNQDTAAMSNLNVENQRLDESILNVTTATTDSVENQLNLRENEEFSISCSSQNNSADSEFDDTIANIIKNLPHDPEFHASSLNIEANVATHLSPSKIDIVTPSSDGEALEVEIPLLVSDIILNQTQKLPTSMNHRNANDSDSESFKSPSSSEESDDDFCFGSQKKLKTTPEKAQDTLKKARTTPKKIRTTPKKLEVTPKKAQSTPEKKNNTPEKTNNTPEKGSNTSKNNRNTPRKVQSSPKRAQTILFPSKDQNEITSSNLNDSESEEFHSPGTTDESDIDVVRTPRKDRATTKKATTVSNKTETSPKNGQYSPKMVTSSGTKTLATCGSKPTTKQPSHKINSSASSPDSSEIPGQLANKHTPLITKRRHSFLDSPSSSDENSPPTQSITKRRHSFLDSPSSSDDDSLPVPNNEGTNVIPAPEEDKNDEDWEDVFLPNTSKVSNGTKSQDVSEDKIFRERELKKKDELSSNDLKDSLAESSGTNGNEKRPPKSSPNQKFCDRSMYVSLIKLPNYVSSVCKERKNVALTKTRNKPDSPENGADKPTESNIVRENDRNNSLNDKSLEKSLYSPDLKGRRVKKLPVILLTRLDDLQLSKSTSKNEDSDFVSDTPNSSISTASQTQLKSSDLKRLNPSIGRGKTIIVKWGNKSPKKAKIQKSVADQTLSTPVTRSHERVSTRYNLRNIATPSYNGLS